MEPLIPPYRQKMVYVQQLAAKAKFQRQIANRENRYTYGKNKNEKNDKQNYKKDLFTLTHSALQSKPNCALPKTISQLKKFILDKIKDYLF